MEFNAHKFRDALKEYRARKGFTIKELADIMASRIDGLTGSQARHYLEGRCPRSQEIRDGIIRLLDLNWGQIYNSIQEGAVGDVEVLHEAYRSYRKNRQNYEAQDQVALSVVSILKACRIYQIVADVFFRDGVWTMRLQAGPSTNIRMLTLKPGNFLFLVLINPDTEDPDMVVTLSETTLAAVLERVRQELLEKAKQ
jgi:transcriptional regulator with XRE-family HTH domain